MKNGDILLGRFLSKDFLFKVMSSQGVLSGLVLAHNLEGRAVSSIDLSKPNYFKHKEFKKVSISQLPLYLDMKVLNPEFLKLIKEKRPKCQEQ